MCIVRVEMSRNEITRLSFEASSLIEERGYERCVESMLREERREEEEKARGG